MIDIDKPVIFDCHVDQAENCFPMIPSGKPHNQMLLGPTTSDYEVFLMGSLENSFLLDPHDSQRLLVYQYQSFLEFFHLVHLEFQLLFNTPISLS